MFGASRSLTIKSERERRTLRDPFAVLKRASDRFVGLNVKCAPGPGVVTPGAHSPRMAQPDVFRGVALIRGPRGEKVERGVS